MKLHTLKPAEGSIKKRKRVGRGQGSGRGGTSTRGHNGAQSRSGYKKKASFEGGQMPLQRRVPKFGFTPINRIAYKPINLDDIQSLAEKHNLEEINVEVLFKHGLVGKKDRVKILGRGTLSAKVNVTAHSFSKSALELIEKQGGKVTKL